MEEGASKEYENKLKAFYHHAEASQIAEKAETHLEQFDFKALLIAQHREAVNVYEDAKMQEIMRLGYVGIILFTTKLLSQSLFLCLHCNKL